MISFPPALDPPVEFLVIIFHCPETNALSHAFLSYIFPSYWVSSYVVVRHLWLGLDYSTTISYRDGFFTLFKFGGVYRYLGKTRDVL